MLRNVFAFFHNGEGYSSPVIETIKTEELNHKLRLCLVENSDWLNQKFNMNLNEKEYFCKVDWIEKSTEDNCMIWSEKLTSKWTLIDLNCNMLNAKIIKGYDSLDEALNSTNKHLKNIFNKHNVSEDDIDELGQGLDPDNLSFGFEYGHDSEFHHFELIKAS